MYLWPTNSSMRVSLPCTNQSRFGLVARLKVETQLFQLTSSLVKIYTVSVLCTRAQGLDFINRRAIK